MSGTVDPVEDVAAERAVFREFGVIEIAVTCSINGWR